MPSPNYKVFQHSINCQHIREYAGGTKDPSVPLTLAINEYRPLNNLGGEAGSITIIATHANGFPKEIYEPLWEELIRISPLKIRGIWIADCCHQGASGVANEYLLGDDTSWFDHSRDLLSMVNHFRDRIVQPIFGIGHSMGAAQLVRLSIIHPRLFYGLTLIEPVIQAEFPPGPNPAMLSTFRRDIWPSKEKAVESMTTNPFFKSLDPRAMKKYLEFGFRRIPTAIYPTSAAEASSKDAVALTTSKHQEAWSYCRANFTSLPKTPDNRYEHLVSPEFDPSEGQKQFARPETMVALADLLNLRPGVLWMFGSRSPINFKYLQDQKMKLTGTGRGGSGGEKVGRVERSIIDAGHLVPFEKISECADTISSWLKKEVQRNIEETEFLASYDRQVSQANGLTVSNRWKKEVGQKPPKGKL